MTVSTAGSVGIGTTTPAAKLEVAGNVVASGNIGIGTTTPADRLYIAGEGASGYAIGIEGNARQNRDKGGWVKAMAKVNADGSIARQYNAFGGTSLQTKASVTSKFLSLMHPGEVFNVGGYTDVLGRDCDRP